MRNLLLSASAIAMLLVGPSSIGQAQTVLPAPFVASAQPAEYSSSARGKDAPAPAAFASASAAPKSLVSEGGGGAFSGLGADVTLGLNGIGFDVATPLIPSRLNLRAGGAFFSYSINNLTVNNMNANASLKLGIADIMADFFPWGGRFRISGGLSMYNNNNVSGTLALPGGQSFTVNNRNYYSDPSNPTTGNVGFKFGNNAAGRLTFGTGNITRKSGRVFFTEEAGIQFTGAPTVTYALSRGCTGYNGVTYSGCGPIATSDINAEISTLQSDVKSARFWPILQLGVGFRLH